MVNIRAELKLKRKEVLAEVMLKRAKKNARDRNLEFNLTIEDCMDIPNRCPILKTKITTTEKFSINHQLSIDRIDSSKGYIKGNITFISRRANLVKSDLTLEQLERMYKHYKNLRKKHGKSF